MESHPNTAISLSWCAPPASKRAWVVSVTNDAPVVVLTRGRRKKAEWVRGLQRGPSNSYEGRVNRVTDGTL